MEEIAGVFSGACTHMAINSARCEVSSVINSSCKNLFNNQP